MSAGTVPYSKAENDKDTVPYSQRKRHWDTVIFGSEILYTLCSPSVKTAADGDVDFVVGQKCESFSVFEQKLQQYEHSV